ncbi:MAG TPA: HAMP domain-containing sensor histidine kinase [Solirubrobacteraceae bacterium]|nr:HAMP domain-containing sensor histidine kinase [Solirubrobacteraceae bacterium]
MRGIRAGLPVGLRWRLTAWVAAVLLVSAAAVFVVVYRDTGTQIRSEIDRDITGDVSQLAQALRPATGLDARRVQALASHYVLAQPYTASSTLLFALIPGTPTVSNHPEVFRSAQPEVGENAPEQQEENRASRALLIPRLGYSDPRIPDVGRMRILERPLTLGGLRVVVGAGEPLALVRSAQHGVARAFLLAGVVVLVLALIASYLAGVRVSAPLRRMAGVAARVDAGDLGPRMTVSGRRGDEVRVLGEAFNHMLDRLAQAFASQREFVADASHELRTPLTVIRGQIEVLAAQPNPTEDDVRRVERLVVAEIGRISRLVDDLLVLTQAERGDFLRLEPIDVASFVEELWDGLSLTADRSFELGSVPAGTLSADPDRLAQALRNLGRNAVEHTAEGSGLVRLEVAPVGRDRLSFAVVDNGPGIPAAERERVFERFHRVDTGRSRSAGGAGLGLAIVRAIAEAHGGQVRASEPADGHGARMELILPGFRPASTRAAVDHGLGVDEPVRHA